MPRLTDRKTRQTSLVILMTCLVSLPPVAYSQSHCQPYWTAEYKCSQGCGSCGSSAGAGRTVDGPIGDAPLWKFLGNLLGGPNNESGSSDQQAYAANEQGNQAYSKGDWATAATYYQQALQKSPNDPVIKQNLANAQTSMANQQARERADREAMDRLRQNKAAADNMQQSIQHFAQTLNAAPVSGGLDFDGRTADTAPGGGNGGGLDFTATVAVPVRQAASAPYTDPRVVDARNVRSGLSPDVDKAIDGVFASAAPGVSDRVRKGFQAASVGDWQVAQAWFADALNRDPGNVALKNMLSAARAGPPATRVAKPASMPQDEVVSLYQKGYEAVAAGDRAGAIAALEAAVGRDPHPSNTTITYLAYLRAVAAGTKNQALQLPAESDIQFLFPGPAPSMPTAPTKPAQGALGSATTSGQGLQLPLASDMNPFSPVPPTKGAAVAPPNAYMKLLLDAMTGKRKPASSKGVASVRG